MIDPLVRGVGPYAGASLTLSIAASFPLLMIQVLALAERSRRRLEDVLLETRRMETLGTFAGGVAHDINNQLTTILGNTDLLRTDGLNDADGHSMRPRMRPSTVLA